MAAWRAVAGNKPYASFIHLDLVADSLIRVHAERDRIVGGLAFEYEPAHLRFFQARFTPVKGESVFGD